MKSITVQEKILILDFGSQYTQLIARRVRELNVYCEIFPFNNFPSPDSNIKGVILSGSPYSVFDDEAPVPDLAGIKGTYPLLGVCYGAQFLAQNYGGEVLPSDNREYGRALLKFVDNESPLLKGIKTDSQVWMSHGDAITRLPDNFKIIGSTADVEVGAFTIDGESSYGIQFHPEVYHTSQGKEILKNFIVDICGCAQNWTPGSFVDASVKELRKELGDEKLVLGLSGGVDSSVAAILLTKAIGGNLTSIFVDNGLLRKGEYESVLKTYEKMGLKVVGVNAGQRFLTALEGISEPEHKRKVIGRIFIEVFEEEAQKLEGVKWLAQGTIYPDVIESVSVNGPSATIKSHHNVGGLPDFMKLKIIEPLKLLFKDEVRRVGRAMNMEHHIIGRHPFPGPGLAIRIIGVITPEKVRLLQEADDIFIRALKKEGHYDSVWQAAVILLPVQTVGVMGDERTYENVVVLRAVSSTDGMTADWSDLPHEFLGRVSNEIINRVRGINRVVYDISSKPPSTIEWE